MKAIQVRYIPATNTKPSRLKVWAEGVRPQIYSYEHDHETGHGAKAAAQTFSDHYEWGKVYGFGMLANGDYVATLEER